MSLRIRMALLMVLLTVLPAVPAVVLTRQLVQNSLHLGLSADVDAALDAGVRQARSGLQAQRRDVRRTAAAWAARWPGPDVSPETAVQRMQPVSSGAPSDQAVLPASDRVVLSDTAGQARVVQAGDEALSQEAVPARQGEPPRQLLERFPLSGGWALEVRRVADMEWHADATFLASTLQVIRGLKAQQGDLERAFWLPFLLIYGVAVLLGLIVALRLGRGITSPVQRLLGATHAVASGDWNVQVPAAGSDEIGQLTNRFNAMVRTLDAQSRRLVDLETMAAWREMARALAHEVKNPLTPIQLTVEEMRERYSGSDAKYQALLDECTRIVVEEVDSLRRVVTRFREFSRPVELRPAPVDLNRLVKDVAVLQRDLEVHVELAEGVGEVDADADRLRQVLMNLAENARGATGGLEQPQLWLTTSRHGDSVTLRVEDNGHGIPENERERIFEPYRSGTSGGLGLGLALVKGIVLAHHGSIEVEVGREGGACFRIELPCRQPLHGDAQAAPNAVAPAALESHS